jgi:MinD-like ATPase involved in chromosome partitioning or flagellar assembly
MPDFDEEQVAAVVQEYRRFFELIVIDSPAILPTGGGRLVECADSVVIIAEWNRTDRNAVLDALAMLEHHGAKVAGVVLNKVALNWYSLFARGKYPSARYYTVCPALIFPNAGSRASAA